MGEPAVSKQWEKTREVKRQIINEMGPCYFCGTMDDIEIHHVNPEEKLSHKIWSWNPEKREAELMKCIPMCKACHDKYHALQKRKPMEHGTWRMYQKYGCRCEKCKAVRANYYAKTGM